MVLGDQYERHLRQHFSMNGLIDTDLG
jgi:hypothetical protein